MSSRITRITVASAIAAAAIAATALPAFADGGAGGPIAASVTVPSSLTFTFTSGTSFSLAPGVTSPAAVAWTVATNDPHGYSVVQSAPDLTGPSGTLPAGDLSEVLHFDVTGPGGSTGVNPSVLLTNAPASAGGYTTATAGDTYAEDWLATLPGNTVPGTYSTTISYLAVGA